MVSEVCDVVVAAPTYEASCASDAIGSILPGARVEFEAPELSSRPHVPAFAVAGPPARCVIAAALGVFGGALTVVLSSVNLGVVNVARN